MKHAIQYLLIMALFCNSQPIKSMQLRVAMALAHAPKNAIARKSPLVTVPRRPYISEVARNCKPTKAPNHQELLHLRSKLLEEQSKIVTLSSEISTNQALREVANKQKNLLDLLKQELKKTNEHIALYKKPYYELSRDFESSKQSLAHARFDKDKRITNSPFYLFSTLFGAGKLSIKDVWDLHYSLTITGGLVLSFVGIVGLMRVINSCKTFSTFRSQHDLLKQVIENRHSEKPEENEFKALEKELEAETNK